MKYMDLYIVYEVGIWTKKFLLEIIRFSEIINFDKISNTSIT